MQDMEFEQWREALRIDAARRKMLQEISRLTDFVWEFFWERGIPPRVDALLEPETALTATAATPEKIRPWADIEKRAILEAIMETGSVEKAADALRIPRLRIYRRLRKWGFPHGIRDVSHRAIAELMK